MSKILLSTKQREHKIDKNLTHTRSKISYSIVTITLSNLIGALMQSTTSLVNEI